MWSPSASASTAPSARRRSCRRAPRACSATLPVEERRAVAARLPQLGGRRRSPPRSSSDSLERDAAPHRDRRRRAAPAARARTTSRAASSRRRSSGTRSSSLRVVGHLVVELGQQRDRRSASRSAAPTTARLAEVDLRHLLGLRRRVEQRVLLEAEDAGRDVRRETAAATCCTPARARCSASAPRRCGSRCRRARPSAG